MVSHDIKCMDTLYGALQSSYIVSQCSDTARYSANPKSRHGELFRKSCQIAIDTGVSCQIFTSSERLAPPRELLSHSCRSEIGFCAASVVFRSGSPCLIRDRDTSHDLKESLALWLLALIGPGFVIGSDPSLACVCCFTLARAYTIPLTKPTAIADTLGSVTGASKKTRPLTAMGSLLRAPTME